MNNFHLQLLMMMYGFQIPHCYFCLTAKPKHALLKSGWPLLVIHESGSYFTPSSKLLTQGEEKMETRYGGEQHCLNLRKLF